MKTKKSKLVVCLLVIVLLLQSMSIAAFAEDAVSPQITIDDGGSTGTEVFEVPDLPAETDGIEKNDIPSPGSRARDNNTPPVANLAYIVLNPESLKNGAFTTDTMIAWLWSYNGVNYTYDPDGDAITNVYLGGIPSSSIVGYLDGNIGFVTWFSTAAQYVMSYQVRDSRGALSNTLELVLNIEPADDNNRPVGEAVFSPSNGTLNTRKKATISWAGITDNDDIDYIAEARGNVYKDGGPATDLGNYVANIDEDNMEMTLAFTEPGTYEVWFSVRDRWSAWSNWSIFTYEVTLAPPVVLSNLNYSQQTGGSAVQNAYWFNQTLAYERTGNGQYPTDFLAQYGYQSYPLASTAMVGGTWTVSGRFALGDGTPLAYETVVVEIPSDYQGRYYFVREVETDANGYFTMQVSQKEYLRAYGGYDPYFSGELAGTSHYSGLGTASYRDATLLISCDGETHSFQVAQLIGVSAIQIVGNSLYDRSSEEWYSFW